MNEEIVEGLLTALVEDHTLEELNDLPTIKQFMKEMMGIKEEHINPILAGAIRIKLLRNNRLELWQQVVRQRFIKH